MDLLYKQTLHEILVIWLITQIRSLTTLQSGNQASLETKTYICSITVFLMTGPHGHSFKLNKIFLLVSYFLDTRQYL